MSRHYHEPREFPDEEDIFARAEVESRKDRVERARLENEKIERQIAEQEAERKIKAIDLTRRANQSIMRHEYESRGLQPPFTNADGMPTVSLQLLIWQGWRVEQVADEITLVRPVVEAPRHRKSRADYDGGGT